MNCPECESSRLNIYDSRHLGDYVIRKRKCLDCDEKFYTIESYLTEDQLEEIENLKKGQNHDCGHHHLQESN
jgi:transcriptional regulator NrdR family protein